MSPRAWAVLGLLGCGLLVLTTTQPWVRTVTEVAPGAPRTRGAVAGADLVPWLAPLALVAGLAVVAGLAGMRWARGVAALAAVAVPAGAAVGVLRATTGGGGGPGAGDAVVSTAPTGWLGVGVAAAVVAGLGTLLWCRPRPRDRAPGPSTPQTPAGPAGPAMPGTGRDQTAAAPDDLEAERRRTAADWRDLSEGRDPTDP